jgi:hypothetical protein
MQVMLFALVALTAAAAFYAVFRLGGPRIVTVSPHPQWQRFGTIAIAAAAAIVVLIVGAMLIGTRSPSDEQTVLKQVRQYRFVRVLEQYQPGARAQVEALVHEAVTKNDPAIAQVRTTELVQQYFPQYVPRTSDDAILSFASSLVDLLAYFEASDVETCKTLASGGQLTTSIPPERMNATLDAMADVIEDAAIRPQPAPDTARAQTLVQEVVTKLYASNDPRLIPIETLVTPQRAPADKLCHTMQSFYRTVLSLPKNDGSIVLRTLISSRMR